MASLKDMRVRIASTKATQKITKAMQMVAASKLRRAQTAAEAARPYAEKMDAVISNIASAAAGSPGWHGEGRRGGRPGPSSGVPAPHAVDRAAPARRAAPVPPRHPWWHRAMSSTPRAGLAPNPARAGSPRQRRCPPAGSPAEPPHVAAASPGWRVRLARTTRPAAWVDPDATMPAAARWGRSRRARCPA